MTTAAPEHTTGELRIMDPQKGDVRFQWDTSNSREVEIAHAAFDDAKRKGMIAHTVSSTGGAQTGEVVRDFDPNLGTLVMRPQHVGG